jgi:1-acyl-sn-glycerol-3-phosphate acyltransferase
MDDRAKIATDCLRPAGGPALIATLIQVLTGVQARWRGVEPVLPDGSVPRRVFFANHQSHLDALVVWASLPTPVRKNTRPVAARDYWDRTRLRRFCAAKTFNAVLIERGHITKSNNPMLILEQAAQTSSLILFPEGTRREDEDAEIAAFKSGLFHLARRIADLEFVPVYLENLNRILPKGELIFIPLMAVATFGPPLRLSEGEDKDHFLDRARTALLRLREGENDAV